eukprot:scaffold21029_cov101-Isochrysis_galbana.AAC.2
MRFGWQRWGEALCVVALGCEPSAKTQVAAWLRLRGRRASGAQPAPSTSFTDEAPSLPTSGHPRFPFSPLPPFSFAAGCAPSVCRRAPLGRSPISSTTPRSRVRCRPTANMRCSRASFLQAAQSQSRPQAYNPVLRQCWRSSQPPTAHPG